MNPFGHHHHHHSQAVYPPPAVQVPAVQGEIVKIYCEANPDYNLAHCDGDVKMAVANESDPNQQWIMDTSWGVKSKDSAGFPAFALINRATGQAIRHSRTVDEKISLGPYHPDDLNEAVLFTQSADVGNGYQCIRPVYDISLNLDAAPDKSYHKNHSVNISEGAEVSLTKWTKKESQKWRITPILAASQARMLGEGNHAVQGAVVKIHCEANPEFFVSARDRVAVLALEDKYDPHQQWVKVDSWGIKIKDEVGYPAFALVNKATGLALKHGQKEWDQIHLTEYRSDKAEDSILWTLSADVGNGYQCLRPANNIHLNMDAKLADGDNGGILDGNELILFEWKKQSNQKWKLITVS